MISRIGLAAGFWVALIFAGTSPWADAQEEFPPPQGKGPVVVVVSGQMGAAAYRLPAQQIAALGYDVVLLDGNDMIGSQGKALMTAVQKAQSAAHGLPGKVAVVGFSMGGGVALFFATRWADLVSVVVVWYPVTNPNGNMSAFAAVIKVPVLMFAGESDHMQNCCLISTARKIAAAASAAGAPLTLVTYPNVGHDFVLQGSNYDAGAASDSWQRAKAELAQYLGR
jgi:dienelactone hydrolase